MTVPPILFAWNLFFSFLIDAVYSLNMALYSRCRKELFEQPFLAILNVGKMCGIQKNGEERDGMEWDGMGGKGKENDIN